MKRRTVLWIFFALFFGASLFPGDEIPGWVGVVMGAAAWGMFQFLSIDFLMNRWLRRQVGKVVTPLTFFRHQLPVVLLLLGLTSAMYLGVIPIRLGLEGAGQTALWVAAGGCVLIAVTGVVSYLLRFSGRKTDPISELNQRLEPPGLSKSLRESFVFFRTCSLRILPALFKATFFYFILFFLLFFLAYGISYVGALWRGLPKGWNPTQWPGYFNISLYIITFSFVYCAASVMVSSLFFVQELRRVGKLPRKGIWKDIGRASERVEILATMGLSLVLMLVVTGIILLSAGAAVLINMASLDIPFLGLSVFVVVALVLVWWMILYPMSYMLVVISYRDCGWMMAVEAAFELIRLDGSRGFLRFVLVTLLFGTIVGIPMAICLLDTTIDGRLLLLLAVLKEKTWKEVDDALNAEEQEKPTALKKFYTALDKGRYLDALNGFQMYLMKHQLDVNALQGVSLAYLYMGNPRARENLERWVSLDPENEQAARLLDELNAGLWAEEGEKYLEAQKRCTQIIGRGV